MRELKKKLSIRNVSNLLSDKQMKATIGGSGDPGNPGHNCWIDETFWIRVTGDPRDRPCMGGEVCWFNEPALIDVIYGSCKTTTSSGNYTCECIPW